MSEFFYVTLDKDVVLDDSILSNKTGWTSEKIYREIIDKRLTKFEELEDVDVTRKKDRQVLAYSEATGKFVSNEGYFINFINISFKCYIPQGYKPLVNIKFLFEQNDKLYTIKSHFYDTLNLQYKAIE